VASGGALPWSVRGGEERKSHASPIYRRGVEHAWDGKACWGREGRGGDEVARGGGRSSLDYQRPGLAWWPAAAPCHGPSVGERRGRVTRLVFPRVRKKKKNYVILFAGD